MRPLLYFVELCTKCFQQLREVVISLKVTKFHLLTCRFLSREVRQRDEIQRE